MSRRRGRPSVLSLEERTKKCETCGEYFAKPATTSLVRWKRRRFCAHRCWWLARPNWNRYAGREVSS